MHASTCGKLTTSFPDRIVFLSFKPNRAFDLGGIAINLPRRADSGIWVPLSPGGAIKHSSWGGEKCIVFSEGMSLGWIFPGESKTMFNASIFGMKHTPENSFNFPEHVHTKHAKDVYPYSAVVMKIPSS